MYFCQDDSVAFAEMPVERLEYTAGTVLFGHPFYSDGRERLFILQLQRVIFCPRSLLKFIYCLTKGRCYWVKLSKIALMLMTATVLLCALPPPFYLTKMTGALPDHHIERCSSKKNTDKTIATIFSKH